MTQQGGLVDPDLASTLASKARSLRALVLVAFTSERMGGPLRGLYDALQVSSCRGISISEAYFADAYAQALTYQLLCARYLSLLSVSFPPALFNSPITGAFERDDNDPSDPVALAVNELNDFIDGLDPAFLFRALGAASNATTDALVHFYERFLRAYDKSARDDLGVFYTPKPVVTYIVRSIDTILREEFQLEDGLADTTSWAEMAKRKPGLELSPGQLASRPFVQILDPATGSGIFLLEVISFVHQTLLKKWRDAGRTESEVVDLWNAYVPAHLLPRLVGYEVSLSAYSIAFLLVRLKLWETGYVVLPADAPRILLRNALEPKQEEQEEWYTVVLGNPPYRSLSQNRGAWIKNLLSSFREVHGVAIKEKGNRNHLQDDYVKFMRVALWLVETSHAGVCGLITNHGYLFGPTFRGMRFYLQDRISGGRFLDLNGNAKRRAPRRDPSDENIFDIQQGVAISLFWISATRRKPRLEHASIFGSRSEKLRVLANASSDQKIPFHAFQPEPDLYLFEAADLPKHKEYLMWWKLDELMPFGGTGIKTNRDGFVIDFEDAPLLERMRLFRDPAVSDKAAQDALALKENYTWKIPKQRRLFREADQHDVLRDLAYRPFDQRRIYYQRHVVFNPRSATMAQAREGNIFLLACRQQFQTGFQHVFATRTMFECCLVSAKSREITSGFPLYLLFNNKDGIVTGKRLNFSTPFLRALEEQLGCPADGPRIFSYLYAVLHSPGYRVRYAEQLKLDFPRIPLPLTRGFFDALAAQGERLLALHLLETKDTLELDKTQIIGAPPVLPEDVVWSDGIVWVNQREVMGIAGVSRAVWEFQIGGYRVCEKWLKERKGRALSDKDIKHYQTIVAVIAETLCVMQTIDQVIDAFGGWPSAFLCASMSAA